jgi:heptosyltransferase-3
MLSRVLIIFPGALGDLICLAPTMAAIARHHRSADLELMARMEPAEFAVGRLSIARAHSIDRREVALLFRSSDDDDAAHRFFSAFDRIYCFFNADDPGFRRALNEASAPGATSFHRFRPEAKGHIAAAYLEDVTGDTNLRPIRIKLSDEDLAAASKAVRGISEEKPLVAIFPGSGSPSKNWPIEKFSALAHQLNTKIRTIFILGPAEDAMEKGLRPAGHIIIKNQPLGTVAAIASMATAFVGNDSGVSHLAAATGTRGVVLFGPSDPARWRPLGDVKVIHRDPIASIEVGEVDAVLSLLRSEAFSRENRAKDV